MPAIGTLHLVVFASVSVELNLIGIELSIKRGGVWDRRMTKRDRGMCDDSGVKLSKQV